MNQNRQQPEEEIILTEEELAALDRELAQMAQDTPEMPDDFHARWTQQVREEAGQTQQKARTESRRQWRYLLSAAAVFVFLIGGTLLTRNQKITDTKTDSAPIYGTAAPEAVNDVLYAMNAVPEAEYEAAFDAEEADYEAEEDAVYAAYEAGEAAYADEAMGAVYEAAEDSGERSANKSAAAGGNALDTAMPVTGTYAATEAAEKTAEKTAPETAEDAEEAEEAEEAEAAAPEDAEPAAEDAETAEEPAEEGDSFGAFIQDLGAFTLKVLPYLAGAAVIVFLAALGIRKAGKKK